MRRLVDWLAPVFLLPLVIILVRWAGRPQSSFQMFLSLELIVLVSWALAIVFSLWGFRRRPLPLKLLNVTVIVVGSMLALLDGFALL